jgi:hypothetical protein
MTNQDEKTETEKNLKHHLLKHSNISGQETHSKPKYEEYKKAH